MEKKQVFISYKSEEFDEANWVKTVLETNGISCWMAPMCITGGSSYAVEIPQAIRNCTVFVLILSEKSQMSKWVPREVDQAINENKIIMPFMLENCKLKDDFNFYLTNVQRYAAYESKVTAVEKMLREIKAILGIADPAKQEEPPKTEQQKQTTPIQTPSNRMNTAVTGTAIQKSQKKKGSFPVVAGIIAIIILLLIGTITLVNKLTKVTIAGETIKKSTTYISLMDKIVTVEDLLKISKLKKLESVTISHSIIRGADLGVLSNKDLIYLTLEDCDLTEEMVSTLNLEGMDELSHLNLSGNESLTKIEDIEAVADTLTYLSINQTNIKNIDFLKHFTQLGEFQANDTGITSLEPLSDCKKLYAISVNGNKLTNLKGLEHTINLQSFEAGYNELTSIEEIGNNILLNNVYLNHNNISDISPLKNAIGKLYGLYIDDNEVTDISCLNGFEELKYFSADRNKIADIGALSQSVQLKELSITENNLTTLAGLENCTNLEVINVSHNQISDVSALRNLPLPSTYGAYVKMENNKITDVSLNNATKISLLNLHGNEIRYVSFKGDCEINKLIYDYREELDYESFGKLNVRFHHVVDCPLDKKIALQDSLKSVIFDTPETLMDMYDYSESSIQGEYSYTPIEKEE